MLSSDGKVTALNTSSTENMSNGYPGAPSGYSSHARGKGPIAKNHQNSPMRSPA